ncbi:MAG: type VI secretion system tube protein Hcp [Acidobacteriota bacterium]|nr:type VI secretion system tube protein Hcp [Acidobacteriota bacterium]
MKELVGLAMAVLVMCGSTLAAGGIFITISSNQGPVKTEAQEFRYSQSPRDLAGGSMTSMAAAGAATSARGASGGRAAMRRINEPVVIVRNLDEASPFFVKAAASGDSLTSVVFEFTRAVGTGTEVYQTVRLTNGIISSVKTINGGIQPTEEVSFTFQKIEYENKDGAAAALRRGNSCAERSRAGRL